MPRMSKPPEDDAAHASVSPSADLAQGSVSPSAALPQATPELLATLKLRVVAEPDDARGWAELIRVAQALDAHEEVVEGVTRLLAYAPGDPELLLLRAEAWRELAEGQAAVDDVSAVLATNPDHIAALLERVELMEDDGDLESALVDLDRLVLLLPEDAALRANRAEKRLALDQIALALQDFDALVALEPDAGNLRRRADVLGDNGRYLDAAADLERAGALDPRPQRNTIAWLGLAKSAMEARQLGMAEVILSRANAVSPAAALLLMRAQLYTILGQPERARADRNAAELLDPGEAARLIAQIHEADEHEHTDVLAVDQVNAEFFAGIEMTAEALEAIGYATDLANSDEPERWLEALTAARVPGVAGHLYLARAAVRAERWERAEAELEAALGLSPLNVHALKELGWVATRLGDADADHDSAARRYRRALEVLERLPESARERRVRLMYASVLARNRRHDEAEAVLAALIDEVPEDADAWLVRGGMRRQSRPDEAWGDFERAAELGSEIAKDQLARRATEPGGG